MTQSLPAMLTVFIRGVFVAPLRILKDLWRINAVTKRNDLLWKIYFDIPQAGFLLFYLYIYIYVHIYRVAQKGIHSLLINVFGINLNEISISGWQCNIIYNSRTSLISILLLYKYSSYDYRVIFFVSKCVYIFWGHSVYIYLFIYWACCTKLIFSSSFTEMNVF
jgi:hypothetical protein